MIDLDRLYKDADDALKYNETFLRIVQETKEGLNLAANFIDTERMQSSKQMPEFKR